MKSKYILLISLLAPILMVIGRTLPERRVSAAPQAQGFVTSTPGSDGRIIYVVVEGDTCLSVAIQHGMGVGQLRQFNSRLDADCTLLIGQQLVVGLANSSGPTAGPAPTLPPPTVTATPVNGTTEVCILLFDDLNGDAMRQETEFGITGGVVSLTNLNGSYSQTLNTTSEIDPDLVEPIRSCFIDVPQGEYNVSVAPPDGYNPTMVLSYKLTVRAGDRASIDFGAQSKTITVGETTVQENSSRSAALGVFGVLLLLASLGLGYYAYRSSQPKSRLKRSPLDKK